MASVRVVKPSATMPHAADASRDRHRQIQVRVTVGALRPTNYYSNWDPFITAR